MEKNIENEYINEVSYTDPNNRYNINYNINFHDNKLNNTTIIKNMNNKNIHYNLLITTSRVVTTTQVSVVTII